MVNNAFHVLLAFSMWGVGADLSHELLGREHQLMVDEPARLLVEQRAVGVDVHRLLVLHRLVPPLAEPRRVVEVPRRHRLGGGVSTVSRC